MFATKGIWCGSTEAGKTRDSVDRYVGRMAEAGFNLLLVHLKGGDGKIYWPSSAFNQCVADGYDKFDLPEALLKASEKHGVRLHAWFIDYFEGSRGAAYRAHPEWAARNRLGKTTESELLRGRPYDAAWMCPAQRPGYTDQWLVPLYEDFASRYNFEAIHHDYVRYPGDLAPDQYCFCDYCLENIPKWAGFINPSYPEESFYHELYDRPYLEAHWEQSPRVLPANWGKLAREFKADFLLNGSFFLGGRSDLDYFFYLYRVHFVKEFARLAKTVVNKTRTGMKLSAAVFKNPIHSGRFIGQDWRTFAGAVDQLLPMDYRDHYPGTFEQYLTLLKDSIHSQQEWASEFESLWPGIAVNFLFKEELASGETSFSGEKLERVIAAIAETGVEGMAIFCESQLDQFGQWETLRRFFTC